MRVEVVMSTNSEFSAHSAVHWVRDIIIVSHKLFVTVYVIFKLLWMDCCVMYEVQSWRQWKRRIVKKNYRNRYVSLGGLTGSSLLKWCMRQFIPSSNPEANHWEIMAIEQFPIRLPFIVICRNPDSCVFIREGWYLHLLIWKTWFHIVQNVGRLGLCVVDTDVLFNPISWLILKTFSDCY